MLIVRYLWNCCGLPFLGSVMTKDWVHGVGHSLVCQILLQIVVRAVITFSPPIWTSSDRRLSTPADFPFFSDCTAASTLWEGGGVVICVCLGTVHYWWISVGLVIVQLWSVFYPSVQYLAFFCEAFSWIVLDINSLLFFSQWSNLSGMSMPSWCYSSSDFLQSHTLFFYPFCFAFFRHLLMLLFTSTHFSGHSGSRFFENFCSDPGFFLLAMFAKDLTGCFSHCCVNGGDHWTHVFIFIVHDGGNTGIFQIFEVKLESCVFWFADSFSGEGGRSSSASCSHFQCVFLENFVFWHCSFLIGSASSLGCNQSGCGVIWVLLRPFSGWFVMTKSVGRRKIVKGGKLQKSESSIIYVVIAEGSTYGLLVFFEILSNYRNLHRLSL